MLPEVPQGFALLVLKSKATSGSWLPLMELWACFRDSRHFRECFAGVFLVSSNCALERSINTGPGVPVSSRPGTPFFVTLVLSGPGGESPPASPLPPPGRPA